MPHDLIIGIDSGGTATRVALAESTGRVLALGNAGTGNLRDAGKAALSSQIDQATQAAFGAAGIARRPVLAGFLGVAGCSTEADRQAVRAGVGSLCLTTPETLAVSHDLRAAHAGAFLDRPGIVMVAGTGACGYGRAASGHEHRAGGWGSRLDDGGSGTWLGLQALAACFRAHDGRGPGSVLSESVPERLGVNTLRDAFALLEAPDYRTRFSALAPLVTAAATQGDAVAAGIIERGTIELADMAAAVRDALVAHEPGTPLTISPVGGVFTAGPIVCDGFALALEARLPGCVIAEPELPPVLGAVFLALRSLGPVSVAQRETLRRSRPD